MRTKVYVEVLTRFSPEGEIRPVEIRWTDGIRYEITRILTVEPRASLRVGGAGIRYTCVIHGKQTYLFLEENRWFVEAKTSAPLPNPA